MRMLYHLWLDPGCRKVRVALGEKKLEHELMLEKVWEQREEFLAMNPAGDVPVLVESDGVTLANSQVIVEYIDEIADGPSMIGAAPAARAEARRLVAWFDDRLRSEVTDLLIGEKVMRRFLGQGAPDSAAIRSGKTSLREHLDYIGWLSEQRRWLAGDDFSIADISAAAHLSCLDYIGDVPWRDFPGAKDWYARVKSRPSFRSVLNDHIPGAPPPRQYADLDF